MSLSLSLSLSLSVRAVRDMFTRTHVVRDMFSMYACGEGHVHAYMLPADNRKKDPGFRF